MNFSNLNTIVAAFFVSMGVLLGGEDTVKRDGGQSWYRGLSLSAPVNPRVEAFQIVGIESEDGIHLVGEFVFFNYKEGDKSPPPVTIKGSKKPDGTFWPHVVTQVTNEVNSPWTTIGDGSPAPEKVSLVVTAEEKNQRWYVNLDAFRPVISNVKYGKVILETGDSAIFEIENLLPP